MLIKKNKFIETIIELCITRNEIRAPAEDNCDIICNILSKFDSTIINNCIEEFGRDYLIDIYNMDASNKHFPNPDDHELFENFIDYILITEFDM
jgi:hypothetical protein